MKSHIYFAVVVTLTIALYGCPQGKRGFLVVQLCLNDEKNLVQFTQTLKSVAQSEGMTFIDSSTRTGQNLKTIGAEIDPSAPVINMGIEGKDGIGVTAGNMGLPNYQVALGFSEGADPPKAHRFADLVVKALDERWHVEIVPGGRGALPLTTCGK
jgi:hypothetical protein